MSLKILFLSSDLYPPHRVDVKVLFGRELISRGHRIDWILQSEMPGDAEREEETSEGKVWVGARPIGQSLIASFKKHILGLKNDLRIIGLMKSHVYDLVIVKDKFLIGAITAVAARLFKQPIAFWLSWPFPEEYLEKAANASFPRFALYWLRGTIFKILLYKIIIPRADKVFVQSEQMKIDVIKKGAEAGKVRPVLMGIEHAEIASFSDHPERKLIPPAVPCFLYLGIISRVRELDILVRVLALVKKQVPDAKLYMVGGGESLEDEDFIMREVGRLNLEEAIVMTGQQPRSIALQYAKEANVCVSPFAPNPILQSTSPTKLVEYLAIGQPVVANDHPEQRQVIKESGAGLCVGWNEEEFANAIVLLLRDKVLRAEMGQKGPEYVRRNRTYTAIADLVETELLDLVKAS